MTTAETARLDEERRARAALTALVEPGDLRVCEAADQVGAAELVRLIAANRESGPPLDPFEVADQLLERAAKAGARLAIPGDPEWPEERLHGLRLLASRQQEKADKGTTMPVIDRTVGPPLALWLRGPLSLADTVRQSV